jgi:hypothetical protein
LAADGFHPAGTTESANPKPRHAIRFARPTPGHVHFINQKIDRAACVLNFLAFLWAANMVSPKPGAAGLPTAATEVKVYGLDLTDYSPRAQFIVLGGGALISALVFAFLQEKVCVCAGGCPFASVRVTDASVVVGILLSQQGKPCDTEPNVMRR